MLRHPAILAPQLAFALAVASPASSWADIVVHDGGVSFDREAAAWVGERTGRVPTRILTPEALGGPDRLLAFGAVAERCEGQPVVLDARARLDRISDSVLSFDLGPAVEALRVLDTLIPCADRPVAARDLARLAFLRGAASFDLGQEAAAAEAMLQAAAFDPTFEGELGFPVAHTQFLASQRAIAAAAAPSTLYVWTPSGSDKILVDGEETEQIRKNGRSLGRGLHLLQIVRSDAVSGLWVRVEGEVGTIVFPDAGARLWADGGRSPGGERALRLLLFDLFEAREGDIHLIHAKTRVPMAATFPSDGGPRVPWGERAQERSERAPGTGDGDGAGPGRRPGGEQDGSGTEASGATGSGVGDATEGGRTAELRQGDVADGGGTGSAGGEDPAGAGSGAASDQATAAGGAGTDAGAEASAVDGTARSGGHAAPAAKPAPERFRRFRIVVGGGYQYVHPFSYVVASADVTVGIWGPIEAGLFVRPSYGGMAQFPGMPDVYGPVLFMPMGVSVGVRKAGWLSPFVCAAFQIAYNRDGLRAAPVIAGVVVQGGLDVSPGDGPFVIRLQGEAGSIGRTFDARVTGGVGVRF